MLLLPLLLCQLRMISPEGNLLIRLCKKTRRQKAKAKQRFSEEKGITRRGELFFPFLIDSFDLTYLATGNNARELECISRKSLLLSLRIWSLFPMQHYEVEVVVNHIISAVSFPGKTRFLDLCWLRDTANNRTKCTVGRRRR